MIVLLVYDRSEHSARALSSLVAAVARARSEGMYVDVSSQNASDASEAEPVPSVFVDGVRVSGTTRNEIYGAIALASRRRASAPATSVPVARLGTARRRR